MGKNKHRRLLPEYCIYFASAAYDNECNPDEEAMLVLGRIR